MANGAEFPVNGIHSGKELGLLLGSNLCTKPGADLAVEQRPQPWREGAGTLCPNSTRTPGRAAQSPGCPKYLLGCLGSWET